MVKAYPEPPPDEHIYEKLGGVQVATEPLAVLAHTAGTTGQPVCEMLQPVCAKIDAEKSKKHTKKNATNFIEWVKIVFILICFKSLESILSVYIVQFTYNNRREL